MEDKKVADYFIFAGLPDNPEPLEEVSEESLLRTVKPLDPIVDVAIINRTLGEVAPPSFECIDFTPNKFPADLNHGSLRAPEMYLCYKRDRDRPPLTDIGVLYEGKERVMNGCEVVYNTPYGRPANVNNSGGSRIYITYRRAQEASACNTLAVTDICVILLNKGEVPPHAFCKINKTLNKGMVGSDVYLCYKKSMARTNFLAYHPGMLCRYPLDNIPDFPLPDSAAMFCLPLGATMECWPNGSHHPLPVFSTFVLTNHAGVKVYGSAVMFYEDYDESKLNEEQKQKLGLLEKSPSCSSEGDIEEVEINNTTPVGRTVHANKSICLLARWPFFDTFKKFLMYLFRMSVSGPHPVPIERHIHHFMTEVPFPSPQRPRILVQLTNEAISLSIPEETPLPKSGASFITLLKNLGPEGCMTLLLCTLMEHKILIHSLRPAVLTSAAEAVANMIFPFHWQCAYIPLCPLGLSDYLNAPCPFIVGVDSRYFDLYYPPSDVTCVDLDTNTVTMAEDKKGLTYKLFPKKPTKVLKGTLERLYDRVCQDSDQPGTPQETGFETYSMDIDFSRQRKELIMETAIQEAFLRFMAVVLRGYNHYLLPITEQPTVGSTDISALFDSVAFLKSRDKAYSKFFSVMLKTQSFSSFIQERSFVSDKDVGLAFFDECTEKVDEYKDEPRLIELEDSSKSERTVFIMPPEPIGLPQGASYAYDSFPLLDHSLFPLQPIKPPSHVAALKAAGGTPCPNSPMTRRTKQEIKSAQKVAQKHAATPQLWAKCLMWHCYSLWFVHLPAYVKCVHSKTKALRTALDILVRMQENKLQPPDEVCYRVLMQLCGIYQQPILAVKVLFEMRRKGVQPNAITYGFYNKAVLESKWPSSDTNAYLMWTKVRNTIMAIAQFRQGLRSRRLSVYSNSESDVDRLSRASIESYLDESSVAAAATAAGMKEKMGEVKRDNTDLINGEGHNSEERTSTGGMSDRGYSSMTTEDGKHVSIVMGSQDSIDSIGHRPSKSVVKNLNSAFLSGKKNMQSSKTTLKDAHLTDEVDEPSVKADSTSPPQSDGAGEGTPHRNGSVDPATGCIVNSPSLLDDTVFQDTNLTISLTETSGGSGCQAETESSTFDSDSKTTNVQNADLFGGGDAVHAGRGSEGEGHLPGVQGGGDNCEAMESMVSSKCHSQPLVMIHSECVHPASSCDNVHKDTATDLIALMVESVDTAQIQSAPPEHVLVDTALDYVPISDASNKMSCSNVSLDEVAELDLLNLSADITSDPLASPTHSIRTPVTENDPLGLFTESLEAPSAMRTSGPSSDSSGHGNKKDLMLDLQFDGVCSTPKKQGEPGIARDTCDRFSSGDASSPGSPTEAWTPLSGSSSQSQPQRALSVDSVPEPPPHTPPPISERASTLPAQSRPGDMDPEAEFTGTRSAPNSAHKKHRMPGRSDSLRSAVTSFASRFSSKFTELKSHMSTPTKSVTDSPGAHQTHDVNSDTLEEEVEDDLVLHVPCNEHPYGHQGYGMDYSNQMPNDIMAARMMQKGSRYPPYVGAWFDGGIKYLRRSERLQGWAHSIGSMTTNVKQSLKDSFTESWGIEDDEDEEDYYGYSDQISQDSGDNKDNESLKGSGLPHSGEDGTDGTSLDRASLDQIQIPQVSGSVQSLSQTFFHMALEVEVCSLSRCQTCQSLLYDEEIMAGWTSDDSNLNTSCQFCGSKFVPHLQIFVKDYRMNHKPGVLSPSQSMESMYSIQSLPNVLVRSAGSGGHPVAAYSQGDAKSAPMDKENNTESPTSLLSGDNVDNSAPPLCNGDIKSVDSHSDCSMDVISSNTLGFSCDSSPNVSPLKVDGVTEGESITDPKTSEPGSHSGTMVAEESVRVCPVPPVNTDLIDLSPVKGAPKKALNSPILRSVDDVPITTRLQRRSVSESVLNSLDVTDGKSTTDEHDPALDADSGVSSEKAEPSTEKQRSEPVTVIVPYLSPLVLRKEIENVLEQEGDQFLTHADFVDEHPIIFWNLVWYFKRLDVPSHITGFILNARSTNRESPPPRSWSTADSRHVGVRATWDNQRLQTELGPPLYAQWNQAPPSSPVNALLTEAQTFNQSALELIVKQIMTNDVQTPIKQMLQYRSQQKRTGGCYRSVYRDILFLSLRALGRENIDHDAFDREYMLAHRYLDQHDLVRGLRVCDAAPSKAVTWCRRMFESLEL